MLKWTNPILLAASVAIFAVPRAHAQGLPPFGSFHHGFPLEGLSFATSPERLDAVCIVRIEGPSIPEVRKGGTSPSDPLRPFPVLRQDAVVLDGVPLAAGSHLRLVVDATVGPNDSSQRPLVVGTNHLVLGLTPRDGKLYLPLNDRGLADMSDNYFIQAHSDKEVVLLNSFGTMADKLPEGKSEGDRLLGALLEAFEHSSGREAGLIAKFLERSALPGWPDPFVGQVYQENETAARIRKIAESTSDLTVRARAYEILVCKWVWRADGHYITALMDLVDADKTADYADDSDPLAYPGSFLHIDYAPTWGDIGSPYRGYRMDYDQTRCNELGITAKPSLVREFLVREMARGLTDVHFRRYVHEVENENPKFQQVILEMLPAWTKTPGKAPIYEGWSPGTGLRIMTNQAELIAYWKQRFPSTNP